jgi:hypothetical protein
MTFRSFLDLDLPLSKGATRLECHVGRSEKRVKLTVVLVRGDDVTEEYHARCGVTVWRGVFLPALRHYAAYNGLTFGLYETAPNSSRALRPTGA